MDRSLVIPLKDLCNNFKKDIVDGPFGANLKREHYQLDGIPVLKIQNIKPFKITLKKMDYVTEEKYLELNRHSYSNGDIIMTKLGNPLGESAIVEGVEDGLIVADLVRIRAQKIDTRYLCYHLNSPVTIAYINSQQKGTTRPRVRISVVRDLPIYTPSMTEQKRIVALLDTVFADLEETRAKTEQNLKNARELFDSYLQQVFSQKGNGWVVKPLDSFSKIVNGHAFKSGDFSPNNLVKSIKITNVGVYEFVEESDNYLPEDYCDKYSQYKAYEGDIVVALTRTIISKGLKVAVVPSSYNGALINQRVAAVHVDEEIMPKEMLQAFLSTKMAIDYVKSNVSELMQPNLSIKDLKAFPIPVPPSDKKESVKNELEVILKQKNKLVDIYNQKLIAIDELKKSILQKAFNGELTTTVK